jgi:hypothetical protein
VSWWYSVSQLRSIPVTVYLVKGHKTVASEVVKGNHDFHFTAAAGKYSLSNSANPVFFLAKAVIRPGATTHVTLNSGCK